MIGKVDISGRSLLAIRLRRSTKAPENEVDAWVDTGFTGELVLPQILATNLGLSSGLAVRATLADGSEVVLGTYSCQLDWFGNWKEIEVIVNTGQFPLLGVGLLRGLTLTVDYRLNALTLV
jgi:clan AA aspartic protease